MTGEKYDTSVGNVVDELKSTKIWKRLNDINPHRANNAVKFVEFIEPYLNSIHEYFPLYTRHDCHHSFHVLKRMGEITRDELYDDVKNCFTYDELFSQIISAYAHDVGMVLFENDEDKHALFSSIGLEINVSHDNKELTSYLRQNHAERGMKFLRKEELKDIIPDYITGLVGQIMKGHNMSPHELFNKTPRVASLSGNTSNPVSLSIILCCADALEFSDTRVIKSAFNEAESRGDDDAQYSLMEMMKHKSVGCGISISDNGLIFATGEFKNAKVLHATHKTLDQIEMWLKEYLYFDKLESRQVLKLNSNTIYRDSFTTDNFSYYPVAIKMDEYQIRETLTSKNMWGNTESLPVKELIQNSIDACRYREYLKPNHIVYEPRIDIVVNYDERTIGIRDNGIGMSENDVVDYFLQIGKSKTRSSIFKEDSINSGFSSLARYGIGFWSVFSIADRAEIKTKYNSFYEKKPAFKFNVEINPLKSFLELRPTDIEEGTQITIKVKADVDLSKIVDELTRNITVLKIKCTIINENGETLYKYPKKLKEMTHEDIFGYRAAEAKENGIKVFSYQKQTDRIEISMGLSYSEINGEYRCLAPDGRSMFNYAPYNMGIGGVTKTSVCGLTTMFSFGTIPFAIDRVGTIAVDIKDPEGLDFSLSRKSLIENSKYNEIKSEVIGIIGDALSQFYDELKVKNDATKMQVIIDDSKSNGGAAGDTRIPRLYEFYIKYYKNLVPIELLYWKKVGEEVHLEKRNMFLHDFWNIKNKVYYACVWPDVNDSQKKLSFIKALVSSVFDTEGYILWAYQEAISLVEIANDAKVININIPYFDWHMARNEVIMIDPSKGYELCDKNLFEVKSRWSGHILSIQFEGHKGSRPWYNFGRYIMYVDEGHQLIQHIINLSNQGKMWECGDLIALMSSNDKNVNEEIKKRTGITPVY